MPIKRPRDEVRLYKYFDRKFFIKPFICTKCGNEIWFEYGLIPNTELRLYRTGNARFSDDCQYHYLYDPPHKWADKFCDLCSRDIEYIFKTFDGETALNKLADWLDGVPVEKL